jgi:hypothetical protein
METPVGYAASAPTTVEAGADDHTSRTSRPLRARDIELEDMKRHGGGLLDARQLAELAGCSLHPVFRYAEELEARHEATRATGDGWHGKHGTWLFRPSAVQQLQALRDEGKARNAAALALARSEGRTAPHPRTGVEKPCPCRCGEVKYLWPCRATRPGYHSLSHWARHKTKHGLGGIRNLFKAAGASPETLHKWGRRWNGMRGGRPRATVTDTQRAEIESLAALGWGRRAIATRLLVSEWAVRNVLGD